MPTYTALIEEVRQREADHECLVAAVADVARRTGYAMEVNGNTIRMTERRYAQWDRFRAHMDRLGIYRGFLPEGHRWHCPSGSITVCMEAPLGDYELVGNWGRKEKSNSFNHAVDRRLLQSPKAQAKVRQKFGKTNRTFNLFFVNLPGVRKHQETGLMHPRALEEEMPKIAQALPQRLFGTFGLNEPYDRSINVIFVGNAGANRVMLTPWMMAHRIGHAIRASADRNYRETDWWGKVEKEISYIISEIFLDVYRITINRTQIFNVGRDAMRLADFLQQIGTTRACREHNLGGRPYEFVYEVFAQYVTTGRIRFNPIPMRFSGGRWGKEWSITSILTPDETATYNDLLDTLSQTLPALFENALENCKGQFLVM